MPTDVEGHVESENIGISSKCVEIRTRFILFVCSIRMSQIPEFKRNALYLCLFCVSPAQDCLIVQDMDNILW